MTHCYPKKQANAIPYSLCISNRARNVRILPSLSHQEHLNICTTQTVALHVTGMLYVTRMPYEKCAVIMHYLLQEPITQMHKWQAGYHQLT